MDTSMVCRNWLSTRNRVYETTFVKILSYSQPFLVYD